MSVPAILCARARHATICLLITPNDNRRDIKPAGGAPVASAPTTSTSLS